MDFYCDYDVVVIGGGPAGLLAAGRAASMGVKVILLEKMEKPARKLRITGKGRCNITNVKPKDDFFNSISPEPQFLTNAFESFFHKDIIALLNNQGVETVVERGQRVFPRSGKAWDVAEGLIKWAKSNGVVVSNFSQVTELIKQDNRVKGVKYINTKTSEVKAVTAKVVIVATGGKSYPATGSTGDGYRFAQQANHRISKLFPALTGIETNPVLYRAVGLNLRNIQLSLFVDNDIVQQEFGELDIAEYGFEGPVVLKISRKAIEAFISKRKVELVLDLKPALSTQKLENRIIREIESNSNKGFLFLLKQLLPSGLVPFFIKHMGVNPQAKLITLSVNDRKRLTGCLKNIKFEVVGYRDWEEAIITAGGVLTKEIDPLTMESKLIDGLFFAGEVIDVDGNTGGYNLQIAYSTGWLAGESAARKIT